MIRGTILAPKGAGILYSSEERRLIHLSEWNILWVLQGIIYIRMVLKAININKKMQGSILDDIWKD